jgi:hypothetical protein
MKPSDLRVPHFLRVTRALALVSGIGGLPAAMIVACGGSSTASDDGGAYDGVAMGISPQPCADACGGGVMADDSPASPYDGFAAGVYDGSPMGVIAMPYDGGPLGVVIHPDASPYDGRVMGVVPITDASFHDVIAIGGPLDPPELPA